jgi:hypothetical protein
MAHDPKPDSKVLQVVILSALALLLSGCGPFKKGADKVGTYEGPSVVVGQGRATAFVTLGADGKPEVVGIKLTEKAMTGLPAEPPDDADGWEYVLELPSEAVGTGYDHIGVDWNPEGHIPPGIYDKPHFDFHFYLISADDRNKITAVGDDLERAHKPPSEDSMPAGYILPPGTEVPRMGAHAIDPEADEFKKKPFTKTFIYGYYDGQLIFLEPMVTQTYLETRPSVIEPVKVPKTYTKHGYYPTRYGIKYDANQGEYQISLEGLEYH